MIQAKIIDLLSASGMLVLLLSSFLGIYRPHMQRLAQLHTQQQTLQQQLDTGSQLVIGLNQIQAEIATIKQRLAEFDQQLPREAQLDSFLLQIDRAASQAGFKITMIKPGNIQHEELYSKIAIAITAESRFPEFYDFLSALSQLPRLTKVDDLMINKTVHDDPSGAPPGLLAGQGI
jgi:Tfp pilus assembly protein PilO